MNRIIRALFLCILSAAMSLGLSGCGGAPAASSSSYSSAALSSAPQPAQEPDIDLNSIPPYQGSPYVVINRNVPDFPDSDKTTTSFERYSPLDNLGRCGPAYANVSLDTMPVQKRGPIGSVHPSGWHLAKYPNVQGHYLYNRCHLLAYELTAENANPRNLITGTRYLNIRGMLPFENRIAEYVRNTGNHVLYRVTPIFEGNDLVARGVHMEAYSVEDQGQGLSFNIFCYNVQPGITIDYATGNSSSDEAPSEEAVSASSEAQDYVINKRTRKFHYPWCTGVQRTSVKNREEVHASRDGLIQQGYRPCGLCHP
jgi:DNA-entry nuclease